MSETRTKERDILALAEGQPAILVGRGWEAPGYWRWEKTRRGRMVRAYYDTSNPRRTVRISPRDLPEFFRPLRQLHAEPPLDVRPSLEAPFDIGRALAAFEARLHHACKVDDALPDRERGMLEVRILWPATSCGPGDYAPNISTAFRPSRADIDEWFSTMRSLRGARLSDEQMFVVRLRAIGFSFRTIGKRIKRNESRTRAIYRTAIAELWRAARANSQPRAADAGRLRRIAPQSA